MRKLPLLTALAISALSLSTHSSEAQGYAPWPPPPGMTAVSTRLAMGIGSHRTSTRAARSTTAATDADTGAMSTADAEPSLSSATMGRCAG